ncbi:ADP-ribosylhydrolase ARH3 [Lepeophtheirus salmonis]|uniref:ADP-ribosylhydrolase ARH3 n=1 Tax=Lepeophtheirus salmonis TaxID=72036 RepID=C1BV09_LEPSM|nr:ADP-ribose glycohydrolase ARH3-like [Lepeophtheirus salmonis]XP_040580146.1 ADP-ribose glycohydrolase ARH3-like [Lepeophtheirus salmonis]XP_040580147.1 ADP-ribose glycohydrolase ARH3-like [Lepeophtheirus salmonis]ACO12862.1 PolyADP-ribose glycohydrolase ARH3 [Lepeophtheirus salmonis]
MRKSVRDGFRGCMIGAVIGDAMGSPVECKYWNGISEERVRKEFEYNEEGERLKRYTDDTAMARELAQALIESKDGSFPSARTIATRFYQSYFKEPLRGYGSGVVSVFKALKESNAEIPFLPASKQFNGLGSYGNGASMRVHPIALYSYHLSDKKMLQYVETVSKLTHFHNEGVNGALIQCMAVRLALRHDLHFLNSLLELSKDMVDTDNSSGENDETFASQIKLIESKLKDSVEDIPIDLGNDISALKSVPTSIFSFLKTKDSTTPFDDIDSPFQRALMTAISFGGDTDTIASMTGAIAGAWYGESGIPSFLMDQCEWIEGARTTADALYELIEKH